MVSESRITSEMLKAINNLAKCYQVSKEKVGVKITFGIREVEYEGEKVQAQLPVYNSLIDYKPKEEVSIEKLLAIKYIPLTNKAFDPFNLIQVVPSYIHAALHYLIKKDSINSENVSVFILMRVDEDKKEQLLMWLYDCNKPVRQVSAAELFNEQNMQDLFYDIQNQE
jgi:hypothetical protein